MYQNKKFWKAFKIKKFVRSEESLFDVMVSGTRQRECNGPEKCVYWVKGDHPSYSHAHAAPGTLRRKSLPQKIKNRLTYPRGTASCHQSYTYTRSQRYAAVAKKKVTTSLGTQTSPVTIIDNSKEKAPEQPSQKT
ncbi:hypothetical protein TNCV_4812611 [Trichonephila clavipes]|nr:hypothetical protein TNCV_4812611 [Trichonephila clavipes]